MELLSNIARNVNLDDFCGVIAIARKVIYAAADMASEDFSAMANGIMGLCSALTSANLAISMLGALGMLVGVPPKLAIKLMNALASLWGSKGGAGMVSHILLPFVVFGILSLFQIGSSIA